MGTDEAQSRLDGAFCQITEADKLSFLNRAYSQVRFKTRKVPLGKYRRALFIIVYFYMGLWFWSSKAFEGDNHVTVYVTYYMHAVAVLVHWLSFRNLWSRDWIALLVQIQSQTGSKVHIWSIWKWTKISIDHVIINTWKKVGGLKLNDIHIICIICRQVITSFKCFTGQKS